MRALVLGGGISGIGAAQALSARGDAVILSDVKRPEGKDAVLSELERAGVRLCFAPQTEELLERVDVLIPSPGIAVTHPLIVGAYGRGIAVWSEVELAYRLTKAPIVAISGTNGKTTTTSLVGAILAAAGKTAAIGGNIGAPLSVLATAAVDVIVAEVSSFQLETVVEFRPRVAVLLNLTPDHLDRHGDIVTYGTIKERIFAKQQGEDVAVLNADDSLVASMAARCPGKVFWFSQKQRLDEGAFVQDGEVRVRWQGREEVILPIQDIPLPGAHNVENVLAACSACYVLGVSAAVLAAAVRAFPGVEHRIEFVRDIAGVRYYNDSKATNPESTIKAIEAFPPGMILIAGGKDKHTPLETMMLLVRERVEQLILLGEAKERFAVAAKRAGVAHIHIVEDVAAAVKLAQTLARSPQTIVLSPACASYDQFANFEERGKAFKRFVREIGALPEQ